MKRLVKDIKHIFGMANINPKRSNLKVVIWSDHSGFKRQVSHKDMPRIKIGTDDYSASVTIEEHPAIKAISNNLKKNPR